MSKYHLQQEVCKAACADTLSAPETAQSLFLTSPYFILFQEQEKLPLTVSKYKPIAFHFRRRGETQKGLCKWSILQMREKNDCVTAVHHPEHEEG